MEKIRRSESAWREIVARQVESGLGVQAFCQREGINAASLYGWRSRLRANTQDTSKSGRAPKTQRTEKPAGEFIDLGALGSIGSRFEVRLDLGGGVLLHLVRG